MSLHNTQVEPQKTNIRPSRGRLHVYATQQDQARKYKKTVDLIVLDDQATSSRTKGLPKGRQGRYRTTSRIWNQKAFAQTQKRTMRRRLRRKIPRKTPRRMNLRNHQKCKKPKKNTATLAAITFSLINASGTSEANQKAR